MTSPARIPVALLFAALGGSSAFADTPDGAQIYQSKCASCHGPKGEGTKKYKPKLEGGRSPAQLADLIRETMPEDDPESLSQAEATAVAAYIHKEFYSSLARERNRPARVELARLTARQHKNALADIVGSFRWRAWWGEDRGLKGGYFTFKSGWFNPEDRVLERTDKTVDFDFKAGSPVDGKLDPYKFAAQWSGSLLAPETGEYEFIIRTDHGTRLFVNDNDTPLIDAWVKSGTDTEFKGTAFLVGGRIYPIRLEFSKAKQGVDDSKNEKDKPKPPPKQAFIALAWKVPHRPTEVISERNLSPAPAPEAFACTTLFPPDDRSYGWERGTTVSKEWATATTEAAIETAAYVAAHLDELAGVKPEDRKPSPKFGNPGRLSFDKPGEKPIEQSERTNKLRAFAAKFAERTFRRPLTADQTAVIEHFFTSAPDADTAMKRVVLWALKSPRFLYREVGGEPDAYDVASRLSFALWDTIPDDDLLKAAAAGELTTREQVQKQAWRMHAHPPAKAKARHFLLTWLKADGSHDLTKDPKKFPGFDAEVISDLRTSLELFLDDVFWSEKADFKQLVKSEEVFLNARLAKFYGAEIPADAGFRKERIDDGKRAGVLTHPYIMATFAHTAESSPIHRGVFLARGLLGVSLKPPPEAVAPLPADLHPTLSTRERVVLQTRPAACMTCHGVINPLGFTMENFDAVGRFRTEDRGKPVDPVGSYVARDGKSAAVTGAKELGAFLAESDEAYTAFCEQMFHHYAQQPIRAYGPDALDGMKQRFAGGGFNVRALVIDAVTTAALQARPTAVTRAP